jgi:hypothetical protein
MECTGLGIEFKSPELKLYENRLQTFESWSQQIQPNKYELASAGFYYTGRGDIVQCFSCAIRLNQWKKTDDPMKEHGIHSKNCLFLKMVGQSNRSENISLLDEDLKWNPWESTSLFGGRAN